MRLILIALATTFLFNQPVSGYPFKCSPTADDLFADLLPKKYENVECKTTCPEINKIYDNCLFEKSSGRQKHEIGVIRRVCARIACNPSLLQKFKYN